MNKQEVFTSTGGKLIHHPTIISRLQHNYGSPISIQMAPTSRCQLNCSFCSNVNRSKHEDLEFRKVCNFLYDMYCLGAKTVEWTGGGDPALYEKINESIEFAEKLEFSQGMITNGMGFSEIKLLSLHALKWIRISMNCLDYVDSIDIPEFPKNITLGFSYVWNEKTNGEILHRLKKYVQKYSPSYVRIVPNCQVSDEEGKRNNEEIPKYIRDWEGPYFYQAKIFEKPKFCYWGLIKPFVLHDGYVYRCSSVVLNSNAERSFHKIYRWCHMSELTAIYKKHIIPYIPDSCDHCVFTQQNNLVHEIINPNKMINFI